MDIYLNRNIVFPVTQKGFMLKFDTHEITLRIRFNTEIFLVIRHCHLENTYGQAYLTLLV